MCRNAVLDPEVDLKLIPTVREEYISVSSMDAKKFTLNHHTLKPIKGRTQVCTEYSFKANTFCFNYILRTNQNHVFLFT